MRHALINTWNNNLRDSLFDDFFQHLDQEWQGTASNPFQNYDLEESESHYLLTFDLPGVEQKDLSIDAEDGVLNISAKRERRHQSEEKSTKSYGRFYGEFSKSFRLPDGVKEEKIEANYENGVLTLAIPKQEKKRAKRIEIQSKQDSSFWSKFLPHTEKAKDLN